MPIAPSRFENLSNEIWFEIFDYLPKESFPDLSPLDLRISLIVNNYLMNQLNTCFYPKDWMLAFSQLSVEHPLISKQISQNTPIPADILSLVPY